MIEFLILMMYFLVPFAAFILLVMIGRKIYNFLKQTL